MFCLDDWDMNVGTGSETPSRKLREPRSANLENPSRKPMERVLLSSAELEIAL